MKTEKDLEYYRKNAEEDYSTTPISVLRYITVLEEQAEQLRKHDVMCEFHCERFDFCRDKKCEQQCSDCHWMQTKSQ